MIDNNAFYNGENPWVVTLYSCFQDHSYLYIIMEYMPGGDLMTQLIRKDVFAEDEARFYVSQLVQALDSVHRMGYIHRDVKPDNVLIGTDGHIKLGDFGLCTGIRFAQLSAAYETLRESRARDLPPPADADRTNVKKSGKRLMQNNASFKSWARKKRVEANSHVGTLDYIAPEILLGQVPYGKEVDWWSLGACLFEMLCGHAPFMSAAPDKQQQFKETVDNIVNFQSHVRDLLNQASVSNEAKDLITKLLSDKSVRLGRNSADEIRQHAWFKGIDWHNLDDMKPPFVPKLKDPTDTSNFDHIEPEPEAAAVKKEGQKDFFVGFTYRNFSAFRKEKKESVVTSDSKRSSLTGVKHFPPPKTVTADDSPRRGSLPTALRTSLKGSDVSKDSIGKIPSTKSSPRNESPRLDKPAARTDSPRPEK